MDISPIQRMAMAANQASRPVDAPRPAPPVAAAQASPVPADQKTASRSTTMEPNTSVVVAWHAGSLGYVTRVVDQHTGDVVLQTPPDQVLRMVEKILKRLEGATG